MGYSRAVLFAMAILPGVVAAQGAIAAVPNDAVTWFKDPCLGDSSDTWGWTRYDLHGIRIRVPREARQVPVPGGDDLFFRTSGASLQLRLHRTARTLFREFNQPDKVYRFCMNDIGGLLAEAISFRAGGTVPYGFAANWSDADRGEYLTAVITGRTIEDVTLLRRALFAIEFPGERRRF